MSDKDAAKVLRKAALNLAMVTHTSAEFFLDLTINELLETIEDLNKEAKKKKHG